MVLIERRYQFSSVQADPAPHEPNEPGVCTESHDPEVPDPEPDWLIDSDEEFAIALDIEKEG